MVMTITRVLASVSIAMIVSVAGNFHASAQTTAKHVAAVQTKTAAASWNCPFAVVELAPVSHDTSGQPSQWVVVHRVKGEIVAAERVSPTEVEQIRAMPCGTAKPVPQQPLLG